MRDGKEEHTRVHLLSAFLRAKDPNDKRERSEFPSNRRISACVRVVVLGVLRRAVFWALKRGSFVGAFAHQACGTIQLRSEIALL